jgi:hypothetical protein
MEQKIIRIGRQEYPILYNANAIRRLELETGHSSARIGLMLLSGVGGFAMLHAVLWAGLEGGRLRNTTRPSPYTMDEVGDLIDAAGGVTEFWKVEQDAITKKYGGSPAAVAIIEAWQSAHPQPRKDMPAGKPDPNADGSSSEQTSGGPTESTPPSSQA